MDVLFTYSEKSKKRTKTVAGTLEPKWNQTFIYSPMKRADIQNKAVEITVYDYDRIGSGEYVGEVSIINLPSAKLCPTRPCQPSVMGDSITSCYHQEAASASQSTC